MHGVVAEICAPQEMSLRWQAEPKHFSWKIRVHV